MKSILEEIFVKGEVRLGLIKPSKAEQLALDKVIEAEEELRKMLSPEQKELFKKFDDARGNMNYEAVVNCFIKGIKIGLMLGIECAQDENLMI